MFVDELNVQIKAGDGGDGVVRWRQEKYVQKGGPAGGDGGNGGDVYVRAVRDVGKLSEYAHKDSFAAGDGEDGRDKSQFGKNGEDLTIDLPVGSVIHDRTNKKVFELLEVGETKKILSGGRGGRGNEKFKSSTNQRPQEQTNGTPGESGEFFIELELVVDAGFVGLPNAGKSSLLNELTNARSKVGAYEFTTLTPHLGELYGFILADIPGLIEGASGGKGLGHKFLRHVKRTQMLVHCISLENDDPREAYEKVHDELEKFDPVLIDKPEIIVLTKSDVVDDDDIASATKSLEGIGDHIFVTSILDDESIKYLQDELIKILRKSEK